MKRWDVWPRDSSFGFCCSGFGHGGSGFGLGNSGFGIQDSGFEPRHSGFGILVSGFLVSGVRVFGCGVAFVWCRVHLLEGKVRRVPHCEARSLKPESRIPKLEVRNLNPRSRSHVTWHLERFGKVENPPCGLQPSFQKVNLPREN